MPPTTPRPCRLAAWALATALLGGTTALAGPPDEPRVVEGMAEVGRPGGELRMLIGRARDTRLLDAYGYARLVAYDRELRLAPDILAGYEVEEGRIFTLRLRRGHKWSDGHPLTSEDFRFFWEDVANNKALSPSGPEIQLLVEDEPPRLEVLDELTVRYTWSEPNPFFLPALAQASQLFIYSPAHYLKPFHERYQDAGKLQQLVKETDSRDWAQLFLRKDRLDNVDNPEMPTLQPWALRTAPPAERPAMATDKYDDSYKYKSVTIKVCKVVHDYDKYKDDKDDKDKKKFTIHIKTDHDYAKVKVRAGECEKVELDYKYAKFKVTEDYTKGYEYKYFTCGDGAYKYGYDHCKFEKGDKYVKVIVHNEKDDHYKY